VKLRCLRFGGSYEERTCLRCFEGRVYDMQRDAWVVCAA
jgi:hypothetical protein